MHQFSFFMSLLSPQKHLMCFNQTIILIILKMTSSLKALIILTFILTLAKSSFTVATKSNLYASLTKTYYQDFYGGDRTVSRVGMDYLLLTVLPAVSGVISTKFTLSSFNPILLAVIKYEFNLAGSWKIIQTTNQTLSCSLVLDSLTNSYGFVQYANNSIQMIYQSNTTLTAANANSTNFKLKKNCFVYDGSILYKVTSAGLVTVPKPSNWNVTSLPQTIDYVATGDTLYRQNANYSFSSIYAFSTTNMVYEVKSYQGRVLVVAANTSVQSGVSLISQTFYTFLDKTSVSLIGQFSIVGQNTANLSMLIYMASLQLTKFGAFFIGSDNTTSVIMKHIDFKNKIAYDIALPQQMAANVATIPAGDRKYFYLGETYLTVRNTSAYTALNPTSKGFFCELINDKATYLGNYLFTNARDKNSSYQQTFLIQRLQLYQTIYTYAMPTGIQMLGITTYRTALSYVIKFAATPTLVYFQKPVGYQTAYPAYISYDWSYWLYNSTANSTNLVVITLNQSFTGNIQTYNSSFSGNSTILAYNKNCILINSTNQFFMLTLQNAYKDTTNTTVAYDTEPLTTTFSNAGITFTLNTQTTWMLASSCDRFTVNSTAFYKSSTQTTFTKMTFPIATTYFDPNLTTALIGSQIWILNSSTNIFQFGYNLADSITLSSVTIGRFNNRLLITQKDTNYLRILAYSIKNGTLTNILNQRFYLINNWRYSPTLRLIMVISTIRIYQQYNYTAYAIDYDKQTYRSLDLRLPINIQSNLLFLEEQFIYFYQFGTSASNHEIVYYIKQDFAPLVVCNNTLATETIINNNNFPIMATFDYKSGNKYYVSYKSSSAVYVRKMFLNFTSHMKSWKFTTYRPEDGPTQISHPGCSRYRDGRCVDCGQPWQLQTITNYICYLCVANCQKCFTSFPNFVACSSCLIGSYLTNKTCFPCDKSCLSCNGPNNTNCTTCFPTQLLIDGTCNSLCPKNCIYCSSTTACFTCNKGFVAINGKCRACAISCSSCVDVNITQCTSCAFGLVLIDSACVPCPDKCIICFSSTSCITCIPGYVPNSFGVCVLLCSTRCATCVDNQPTVCLSCYGTNTYLLNNQCLFNTSCNTDSSCSDCGKVMGYFLQITNCVLCDQIDNCIQCSAFSTSNCTLCQNGYFVDINYQCQTCTAPCLQCLSAQVCTFCPIGYTLPENYTQGQCIKCQSPCVACLDFPTYCLSCAAGFTRMGWRCQNSTYINFVATLSDSPVNVLIDIDNVVVSLLTILTENTTNVHIISFVYVILGSTVISGYATPVDTDTTLAAAALSTALASGTLGNYTVTSSSVTVYTGSSTNNVLISLQILIALIVGLFIIVVVAIIFICVAWHKNKRRGKVYPTKHRKRENIVVQQFKPTQVEDNPSNISSDKIFTRRRR